MQILLLGIDATFLVVVSGCYSVVLSLSGTGLRSSTDFDLVIMWRSFGLTYTLPEASSVFNIRPSIKQSPFFGLLVSALAVTY